MFPSLIPFAFPVFLVYIAGKVNNDSQFKKSYIEVNSQEATNARRLCIL